jgi:hypothetical protein
MADQTVVRDTQAAHLVQGRFKAYVLGLLEPCGGFGELTFTHVNVSIIT